MADCPECGARRGNHLKGCPRTTPAQKAGAVKQSAASKKNWQKPEVQKLASESLVAKWKEKRYRQKISAARKEQHAKGKGGRGGKEPKGKK